MRLAQLHLFNSMKTEEITIQTLPVELRVIRVGGHKMTIAVFEQIETVGHIWGAYSDYLANLKSGPEAAEATLKLIEIFNEIYSAQIIGWVSRPDGFYVLYSSHAELHKEHVSTTNIRQKIKDHFPQLFIAT